MKSPLRISLVFLCSASLWILLSDKLLAILVDEPPATLVYHSIKGLMFVLLAALLIYSLVRSECEKTARATELIKKSEASFRGIFEAHPVALWIADTATSKILAANNAAFRLYGYPKNEFLNLNSDSLQVTAEQQSKDKDKETQTTDHRAGPFKHRRKDGSLITVQTFTHHLEYDGQDCRLIASIDISEQMEAKARADKALRNLAFAEQNKSNILSAVSHELRSPLNAVMGLSQLLEADPNAEAVQEDIKIIHTEAEKLLELVNRLLAAGSIRLGERITRKSPMRPYDCWWDLINRYEPVCLAKGLTLEYNYDKHIPDKILLDEPALTEITRNLLSNAIKFTDKGTIRLSFETAGDEFQRFLRITVSDDGIGISQNDQLRIFDAFVQLDGGNSRHFSGCGIGLFISKELINNLQGSIDVISEPGKGSTFIVDLPLHLPTEIPVDNPVSS